MIRAASVDAGVGAPRLLSLRPLASWCEPHLRAVIVSLLAQSCGAREGKVEAEPDALVRVVVGHPEAVQEVTVLVHHGDPGRVEAEPVMDGPDGRRNRLQEHEG